MCTKKSIAQHFTKNFTDLKLDVQKLRMDAKSPEIDNLTLGHSRLSKLNC